MLELIKPWISTQKAKTQNSIQYIITRVRQLEHQLIITRKQQKEPAGHAFGNAALCGPPTLRNGKASGPFRRSSDHGSQILNRGLSLFRIMVPPPSQVFCRSRWDHSCRFHAREQKHPLPLPVSQNHITRFFSLYPTFSLAAELDSACNSLSPILQPRLHFFWIVTCQKKCWSAKKNVSLTAEINHRQNRVVTAKQGIFFICPLLVQSWTTWRQINKNGGSNIYGLMEGIVVYLCCCFSLIKIYF